MLAIHMCGDAIASFVEMKRSFSGHIFDSQVLLLVLSAGTRSRRMLTPVVSCDRARERASVWRDRTVRTWYRACQMQSGLILGWALVRVVRRLAVIWWIIRIG